MLLFLRHMLPELPFPSGITRASDVSITGSSFPCLNNQVSVHLDEEIFSGQLQDSSDTPVNPWMELITAKNSCD